MRAPAAAVLLLIAAAIDWLLGLRAVLIILLLLALLLWQYRQQRILLRWMEAGAKTLPPDLSPPYDAVAARHYRAREQGRKRKRRLQRFLSVYHRVLNSIPDVALITDRQGRLLGFNRRAQEVLGLDRRLDIGNKVDFMLRGEGAEGFWERLQSADTLLLRLLAEPNLTLEFVQLPFQEGEVLLLARDVSKYYQEQARRKAFVENASHELKTPLTVLCGFVEVMRQQGDMPPRWQAPLAEMDKQGQRMRELLEDMLRLAQLENDSHSIRAAPVAIGAWLEQMAADTEAQFPEGVGIVLGEIEPAVVSMDLQIMASVLGNLLRNALLHAGARTAVQLSAARRGNFYAIEVRDEGIGIAAEHLRRITERFYRINEARGRARGSGLGLAIVKHGIEAHGGHLNIRSQPGKGSTFTLLLPAARIIEDEG